MIPVHPRVLVIDDLREFDFPPWWEVTYARTEQEAIAALDGGNAHWAEIYWDHDLGFRPDGSFSDVRPVVLELERAWHDDPTLVTNIGVHHIMTSSPAGQTYLKGFLRKWGAQHIIGSDFHHWVDWKKKRR